MKKIDGKGWEAGLRIENVAPEERGVLIWRVMSYLQEGDDWHAFE